jgi:hypothetical protein
MNKLKNFSRVGYLLIAVTLLLSYMTVSNTGHASAATPFVKSFVRLDSLIASATGVSGRACFEPSGGSPATIKSVQVTFPVTNGTSYALNATAGNWTITTTNLDTGQNAATNIGTTATTISGNNLNIDFTGGFLVPAATTLYCFNWSGASTLTVPTAGASETTVGSISTYSSIAEVGLINSTSISEPQTVAVTGDTVAVSAVVPPSFSFSLSGYTDTFATNLAIASVNTSNGARLATVSTNAASGWIIWARDNPGGSCSKGGLYSLTSLHCISSAGAANSAPALISTGAENYGFAVTNKSVGSAGTCASITYNTYNYDGITNAGYAGILSNTLYNPIASCSGTSTGSTVSFNELVTITGSTPAASDYADTIQLTGAGQF